MAVHLECLIVVENQVLSVALQNAVAYNALDFRYTKLARARLVGGGSSGSSWDGPAVPVPVAQMSAGQLLQQVVNDWDADDDETES